MCSLFQTIGGIQSILSCVLFSPAGKSAGEAAWIAPTDAKRSRRKDVRRNCCTNGIIVRTMRRPVVGPTAQCVFHRRRCANGFTTEDTEVHRGRAHFLCEPLCSLWLKRLRRTRAGTRSFALEMPNYQPVKSFQRPRLQLRRQNN